MVRRQRLRRRRRRAQRRRCGRRAAPRSAPRRRPPARATTLIERSLPASCGAMRSRLDQAASSPASAGSTARRCRSPRPARRALTKRTSSGRLVGVRLLAIDVEAEAVRARSPRPPCRPRPCRRCRCVRPASSWSVSAWSRPASQPFCAQVAVDHAEAPQQRQRRRRTTCSATERALTPGTLATSTPASVAASIGIMSRPAPWRIAARSFGASSNRAGGQGRAHDDDVGVARPPRPASRHRAPRRRRARRRRPACAPRADAARWVEKMIGHRRQACSSVGAGARRAAGSPIRPFQ